MVKFFQKYWWIFPILGAILIFYVLPGLDIDMFSAVPLADGERFSDSATCERFEGKCFESSVGIQGSIDDKIKGTTRLEDCGIRDGICKCDSVFNAPSCDGYVFEVSTAGAEPVEDVISGIDVEKPYKPAIEAGDDEKDVKDYLSFMKDEVYGIPIWLIILAMLLMLMIFSFGRDKKDA